LPFLQQAPWPQVDFAKLPASKTQHRPPEKFNVANVLKAFHTLSQRR